MASLRHCTRCCTHQSRLLPVHLLRHFLASRYRRPKHDVREPYEEHDPTRERQVEDGVVQIPGLAVRIPVLCGILERTVLTRLARAEFLLRLGLERRVLVSPLLLFGIDL